MLVPPLKVPVEYDIKNTFVRWLDTIEQEQQTAPPPSNNANDQEGEQQPTKPDFTAVECVGDLQRIHNLRQSLVDAITSEDAYDAINVDVIHEYHACLVECEKRGFPKFQDNTGTLQFPWQEGSSSTFIVGGCIYERAACLWNLSALEAYKASKQDISKKTGWMKANKGFQSAYGLMHHVKKLIHPDDNNHNDDDKNTNTDESQLFQAVEFWVAVLQAQAQLAGYEMANASPRPQHLLLAKLATAAHPLWKTAHEAAEAARLSSSHQVTAHAWSVFMAAKAEYHESRHNSAAPNASSKNDKNASGIEIARLERSLTHGIKAEELMGTGDIIDQHLEKDLTTFLEQVRSRFVQLQQEQSAAVVPDELREIRGQLLSKGPLKSLPASMMELKTPLFTNLLSPAARHAIDSFAREMDRFLYEMTSMVEEKTEGARKALAQVNLPHSLTAYKQEQSGGGIPMDLWRRVDTIQKERKISMLKQDLWTLRDMAEQARTIFTKTMQQLNEDIDMDKLFRQQHETFEGHDVKEVQRSFRTSLKNYEKLLAKSQEGDSVLLRRLEILDTDPKYKLLSFQKSQLDRLLPGANGGHYPQHQQQPKIDTTTLSRLLVQLSNLFHEREVTLNMLRDGVKNYNIRAKVLEVDPTTPTAERDYQETVITAQKSFSGIAYEVQVNIDRQVDLLETILHENDLFMQAREAGASSAASDSCIAMMEDAIEEIDQLTTHLKEGKDFYKVVIPKLEHLKQQVGDASVRLTVERCEFEDKAQHSEERRRQEMEDARMAASLAENNNNNSSSNNNNSSSTIPGGNGSHPSSSDANGPLHHNSQSSLQSRQLPSSMMPPRNSPSPIPSQPGVTVVSHSEPQIRVDDEKVASLVAMDFDPDKVVAALKKYDNNMEQALNELLSC